MWKVSACLGEMSACLGDESVCLGDVTLGHILGLAPFTVSVVACMCMCVPLCVLVCACLCMCITRTHAHATHTHTHTHRHLRTRLLARLRPTLDIHLPPHLIPKSPWHLREPVLLPLQLPSQRVHRHLRRGQAPRHAAHVTAHCRTH